MSGDSTATINVPKDVIEPIVRAQVAAGIVDALGDPADLIAKVVGYALKQKVNAQGVASDRDYDNKHDLVELMATKGIHAVVRESLTKWIEEQRPAIEEQVQKALAKKESAFARALVNGLVEATKQDWGFKCDIHFNNE